MPGEGEHKLIEYLRALRCCQGSLSEGSLSEDRHCLYGADADLVLLALATRERNVVILREV